MASSPWRSEVGCQRRTTRERFSMSSASGLSVPFSMPRFGRKTVGGNADAPPDEPAT
jgi:hypothetical protein